MQNKHRLAFTIVGLAVLLILGVILTKTYPIAMVGDGFITAQDLKKSFDIAKKLDSNANRKQVLDNLIMNTKKELLVRKVDYSEELNFYKTSNQEDYVKFLNSNFSGREDLFIQYVVVPKASDALLRIKYNSDFAANNDAHNKAENIITKLNAGQSFESLAKTYSDDKVSGQLGGDLGFMSLDQLLPELKTAIQQSKLGEVKKEIVVSRLGYHIIFPVETAEKDGQKLWHIKHMLIETSGYDNWLAGQLNKIRVWHMIKI